MRRFTFLLLALALLLSLAACGDRPVTDTTPTQAPTEATQATEFTQATEATQITEPATEATEPATEPAEPVTYFKDYEYRYEGRDLQWEEDVVYFAQMYLGESLYCKGHPYLVDKEMAVMLQQARPVLANYYDAALCAEFVAAVNSLLDHIPELSDTQIPYELLRIVALLQDNHSNFYAPMEEFFPLRLEAFWSEDGWAVHATQVPGAYESLLYARLVSINGISTEDVVTLLSAYVCCDYEENALWQLADALRTSYIASKDYLQQAGILDLEEDTALFEFVTETGETVTVELNAVTSEEKKALNMVKGNWSAMGYLDYDHMNNVPFWCELDAEENSLYIRLNACTENTEYRFDPFINQLKDATNDGHLDKIIVDLRHNSGGTLYNVYYKLVNVLKEADADTVYVLTNGSSFSCAFCFTYEIKMAVENAVTVGTPVGQTMQFIGGSQYYELPNSGYTFGVATRVFDVQAGHDFTVLQPDVYAYQTLEDYKNGIDTVLESVR